MKENFFGLTKLCLIQRNLFFDRMSKKYFFDSKKLFSQCRDKLIYLQIGGAQIFILPRAPNFFKPALLKSYT